MRRFAVIMVIPVLFVGMTIAMPEADAQWTQARGLDPFQGVLTFDLCDSVILAGAQGGFYPPPGDTSYVGGAFRSTDDGSTWTPIRSGFPYSTTVQAFAQIGTALIAGTSYGFYISTDGGSNWRASNSGFPGWTDLVTGVNRKDVFALLRVGQRILAATGYAGIYCSTDSGASWTVQNSGLAQSGKVCSLGQHDALTLAGLESANTFVSIDTGKSWSLFQNAPGSVVSFATNHGYLFTGSESGAVYRTSDRGASWTRCDSGLTKPHLTCLTARDQYMVGGTFFDGVFFSTNDGVSWADINSGLNVPGSGIPNVTAIFIGKEFVLAGARPGVWIRPLSELVTSVPARTAQAPLRIELQQNYPNPFNPSTTIQYALPSRSHVTLLVYNTLGQRVAVLQSGEQEAGYHEVRFDGSGLASGVYLYRLTAGGFAQTRKLLFLR